MTRVKSLIVRVVRAGGEYCVLYIIPASGSMALMRAAPRRAR